MCAKKETLRMASMVIARTVLCMHKTVLTKTSLTTHSLLIELLFCAAAPKPIDPSFFGLTSNSLCRRRPRRAPRRRPRSRRPPRRRRRRPRRRRRRPRRRSKRQLTQPPGLDPHRRLSAPPILRSFLCCTLARVSGGIRCFFFLLSKEC